jgi:fido (protein-threonine AMPylation protein)
MTTPAEKLAESLQELQKLQDQGTVAIKSDALTRTHRERLLKQNFIEEVFKGWYIATPPDSPRGDTTIWYSQYWEFCSQYFNDRFSTDWSIAPEQSLMIHAGNTTVPKQLIIRSPRGGNNTLPLPGETSVFMLQAGLPNPNELIEQNGLRLYSLPASLIRCSANTLTQDPIDSRTALSLVRDASELLPILLDGGHTVVAGRIAGAFKNIGKNRIAEDIISSMRAADYEAVLADPFQEPSPVIFNNRIHSPYESRIRLMWENMRSGVISVFPAAPGIPKDAKAYLAAVDRLLTTDAYHSLSIEKYKVTPGLIEKVRSGAWNAEENEEDRKQRDAMAAKGYLEAFRVVEQSIEKILEGTNAGKVADTDHGKWFRELFSPSVTSGILKASDLAGYRTHQVYIGNSMHTPLNVEAVRDAMPVLFELLTNESEASVRAVLGHFIFVFIHPYGDGNGRMGRFLMNVMMASGGYPWTIIPVEQRERYMQALESASVRGDIKPFAEFIAHLLDQTMKGKPEAKI